MTQLVAILNITPDSFSDGGDFFAPDAAIGAIKRYIKEGADIIDIGAESTRPGATPLTPEEEWSRLEPVLAKLREFTHEKILFSIDTRHAANAAKALACGAHWINDVSGFSDPAMVAAVQASNCKLVMMHSLSVPADKNIVFPKSADVIQLLLEFASARVKALQAAGIRRDRIIFDPGIGFGKTAAQSMAILSRAEELHIVGLPLLIGHSRKSFLAQAGVDRDTATLAISRDLALHRIDYLRVHDVAQHRHMLATLKAFA